MKTLTKKRKKRRYSLQISRIAVYSLQEAAEKIGVHPRTIAGWIKAGSLKTVDGMKPYRIRGQDLYECCKKKNQQFKKPIGEGELYCFSCKVGRFPKDRMVQKEIMPDGKTKIHGECEVCGTGLHQYVSEKNLFKFHGLYFFQQPRLENTGDSELPSYSMHLKKEGEK